MSYDARTVERVRWLLAGRSDVVEKHIVGGGLGFMVGGHLCCGVSERGLTVRVGPPGKVDALSRPHVVPLVLGTRETAAFVVVEPAGYADDADLHAWVYRALSFVETLG